MAMRSSYDWEPLYTAAILEPDHLKLKSRIDAAQAAIDRRLREMDSDHGGSPAERLETENAQATLNVLRKRVGMPQHAPQKKG